jgi:hypothetical protein
LSFWLSFAWAFPFFADFFQMTDLVLFPLRDPPAGCMDIVLSPRRNESSRTFAICTASCRVAGAKRYPGAAAAVMFPAPGVVSIPFLDPVREKGFSIQVKSSQ